MRLRPYQDECVQSICAKLREGRSTVAVLATGLGKTVVFSECVRLGLAMPGRRALILAHREELVMQAADKIRAVTGMEAAIEMADYRSIEDGLRRASVVVSSIQTMNAGRGGERRMHRFRNDHPWFVVVDECHHAPSASYKSVINHFMANPSSRLLGVTATTDRLDKRALGQVFESVAYTYDVADGIRDGWLVPIKQRFVQCDHLDLSSARKTGGDFQLNDLEEALEKSPQEMVLPMVEIVKDRRTLVFSATVKHAERVAEILNRPAVGTGAACIVHGGTPRDIRRQMFREYSEGKMQYLVNVGVATEGWDDPALDRKGVQVVAMMRPTQSRSLYCLDPETEILSPNGWMRMGQISCGDAVFQYHPSCGSITECPAQDAVVRTLMHEEDFFGISSPMLDIRVTNKHRMVHSVRYGRDHTRLNGIISEASKMPAEFGIPVCGNQDATCIYLTDDEIRFIGLWMTDGYTNRRNGAVGISQSDRHPECIEYIERVLSGCGMRFSKHLVRRAGESTNLCVARHNGYLFTVSKGDARRLADRGLKGWSRLEPFMDGDLSESMMSMDRRQLLVLIEAMNVGDGVKFKSPSIDWNTRTMRICTASRRLADRMQSICVRRGIRCNISSQRNRDGKIILIMNIDPTRTLVHVSRTAKDRKTWGRMTSDQNEFVWCISVPSGAIICRRHGKVFVTGNCQMTGRGTRALPGTIDGIAEVDARRAAIAASAKPSVLVIDFLGNSGRHQLVHSGDVLGGSMDERTMRKYRKESEKKGVPDEIDVLEMLDHAERERQRQEEARRRNHIVGKAQFSAQDVDPFDALGIVPKSTPWWQRNIPPTTKQQEFLAKQGIPTANLDTGKASQLIEAIMSRPSEKQAWVLRRAGIATDGLDRRRASELIDLIKSGRAEEAKSRAAS